MMESFKSCFIGVAWAHHDPMNSQISSVSNHDIEVWPVHLQTPNTSARWLCVCVFCKYSNRAAAQFQDKQVNDVH